MINNTGVTHHALGKITLPAESVRSGVAPFDQPDPREMAGSGRVRVGGLVAGAWHG